MTYKEIQSINLSNKASRQDAHTNCVDYGRFTVCESSNGTYFIVDPDIANEICMRSWCVDSGGYLVANVSGGLLRLHDYVMSHVVDEKPAGTFIDHINHDKLDNRRQNLRIVSPEESSHNMPLKSNNTSEITGVSITKSGAYRAYITVNKQRMELDYYTTLTAARNARLEAENRFGFKTRPGTVKDKCAELLDREIERVEQ